MLCNSLPFAGGGRNSCAEASGTMINRAVRMAAKSPYCLSDGDMPRGAERSLIKEKFDGHSEFPIGVTLLLGDVIEYLSLQTHFLIAYLETPSQATA